MNPIALVFKRVTQRTMTNLAGKNPKGQKLWGLYVGKKDIAYINRDLKGRDSMEAEIHESLHAIFPYANENEVTRGAEILSYLMYDKLRYSKRK